MPAARGGLSVESARRIPQQALRGGVLTATAAPRPGGPREKPPPAAPSGSTATAAPRPGGPREKPPPAAPSGSTATAAPRPGRPRGKPPPAAPSRSTATAAPRPSGPRGKPPPAVASWPQWQHPGPAGRAANRLPDGTARQTACPTAPHGTPPRRTPPRPQPHRPSPRTANPPARRPRVAGTPQAAARSESHEFRQQYCGIRRL